MKKIACIVAGCDTVETNVSAIAAKFHQIPKEGEARKKWLKAINRTEDEVNKRTKVCSKHFKNTDFSVTRFNYSAGSKNNPSSSKKQSEFKALKNEAVPSLNLPQKSTFKIKISKKDNNSKEIKVEEVKVKEEKIEKVKMPKKTLSEMSPPRSRTQSRRAAGKEALKQMQLLLDDEDDPVEIPDDDIIALDHSPQPPPPKKKYKLTHRKSSDGNDRDVLVLKTITNRNAENTLELDCWVEELEDVQMSRIKRMQEEEKELQEKLDMLINNGNSKVIHTGELNTIIEVTEQVQSALSGSKAPASSLILNNNSTGGGSQSYQLVMDPRLGFIVGAVSGPTSNNTTTTAQPKVYQGKVQVAQNLQQAPAAPSSVTRGGRGRRGGYRGGITSQVVRNVPQTRKMLQTNVAQASPTTIKKVIPTIQKASPSILKTVPSVSQPQINSFSGVRPSESSVEGGLTLGVAAKTKVVVDLTSEDARSQLPDSREISFNKLQGKTYPSLVVVARPHLRVQDLSVDRPKLDSKVKSVLMHAPTKFTEWLIQQGLVRSEQKCSVHNSTQLKLGMYSDVTKFPYSGGYVWISECCPQRFVSVFSGSLFEGSPHPPMVILKLLYHWSCQTNIQNVTQWVKVDNLYVKGMFTWLRSICTVALHTHIRPLGGPGVKVEIGVISLGTTSQDGNQRQVKVEVLGILEPVSKLIRLRAVEPQTEGDRNYKKRFSKILEPIQQWVHPQSILVSDLTIDKQTLNSMGFANVVQTQANDFGGNKQIMEYLRRIVPRMFQNTLSLLSRQIIQQFLDELVWRECFGVSALQAFENLIQHLSEQTRFDNGQTLISRLNKVAQNPFRNCAVPVGNVTKVIENVIPNSNKKQRTRKPEIPKVGQNSTVDQRPPKSTSPDVPEQMVPLENYYYGTIDTYSKTPTISLNMKCPFCKEIFDNNIQLMNHLFKHAHNVSQDAQLCRYCLTSVSTANDLHKHIASAHPAETKFDNGFVCLVCETQYMSPFILGKHMSKEHCPSELPYQCGTCGYRCSNHKQAIDHFYKTHDNGPTIQCPFCLKSTTVFSSSRNIVQNMNYFIQHLQKHQRKQFAKRCGKCNLWFVQKDALKEHQVRMHASQRGKPGLVPWQAPRNGVMVPKSRMDGYPGDGDVVNFGTLHFDLAKNASCKECGLAMDAPKHFPSFESCQNPNCQYSTCCTNAMQEHNAKCGKIPNPVAEEQLPFEMFCICGYSSTDGNQMARHLAICERKSAYPSKAEAKTATVTHSMLDVLGLVRKPEETARKSSEDSIDSTSVKRIGPGKNSKRKTEAVTADEKALEPEQDTFMEEDITEKSEESVLSSAEDKESLESIPEATKLKDTDMEDVENDVNMEEDVLTMEPTEDHHAVSEEKEPTDESERTLEESEKIVEEEKEPTDETVEEKDAVENEEAAVREETDFVEVNEIDEPEEVEEKSVEKAAENQEEAVKNQEETVKNQETVETQEVTKTITEESPEESTEVKDSIREDDPTKDVQEETPAESRDIEVVKKHTDIEESLTFPLVENEEAMDIPKPADSEITPDDIESLISDVVEEKSDREALNFDGVQDMDATPGPFQESPGDVQGDVTAMDTD